MPSPLPTARGANPGTKTPIEVIGVVANFDLDSMHELFVDARLNMLQLHGDEDCLVADGGQAFAETLVRVLRDGAPNIARAGRRLAEQRYSIEALEALIRA